MKPEDITIGMNVTYWPIRHEDGSFSGEPPHTEVRTEVQTMTPHWRGNPPLYVCFIAGKSGFVNIKHLEPR
jgi:hypothetical protein